MGCYDNIRYDQFPKQGTHLNKNVEVIFHYKSDETIRGKIVRDDIEPRKCGDREQPGLTIISLDDGRYVLASECQYSILRNAEIDDGGPYYGLAKTVVPINHRLYYKVELSADELQAMRNAWQLKSVRDRSLYEKLWQEVPGVAVGVVTEREAGGLHHTAIGFLMQEGFDITSAYISAIEKSSGARYNKPAFDYVERFVEGKNRVIAVPRKTTDSGRAVLDELRQAETQMSLHGCSFAEYVMLELGLENVVGIDPTEMKYISSEASEVGEAVWLIMPSLSSTPSLLAISDLVEEGKLLPMRYSEFIAAQEDAYIAAGNYSGSDADYHNVKNKGL